MALSGIELQYLVQEISKQTREYYLSNIYGISRNSILFKLHHPQKHDLLLMVSTFGMWLTSVRIDSVDKNRLVTRLRSDLLRLRLEEIKQIDSERIAHLVFSGFDKKFILVAEFFGDGNIVLCNSDMKILALLHSLETRHRTLKVGLEYVAPPSNGVDLLKITVEDLGSLLYQDMPYAKWIGRNLGLPTRYVEHICKTANIDTKLVGNQLTNSDLSELYNIIHTIANDVVNGNHKPAVVKFNNTVDANPIPLHHLPEANSTPGESFMECLDSMFSDTIMDKGRELQSSQQDKQIAQLTTQINEQQLAIKQVQERSALITNIAKTIQSMPVQNILSLDDPKATSILGAFDFEIISEKGRPLIKIQQKKIPFNRDSSLQAIASSLFTEAKHQTLAISTIKKRQSLTQKKLDGVEKKTNLIRSSITMSAVRKKNWYERYRWFRTSDDLLAIGGRDASSNSAVIRKHMQPDDLIFHAEIYGSPFFVLKDGNGANATSLDESAYATVCFSKAWREGLYGTKAYWVSPKQVKKAAPSGQSMPSGSFMIHGQRNFVRVSSLRLAVGVCYIDDAFVLTCGPVPPIQRDSIYYSVIEPTGTESSEFAKKIKSEFSKMNNKVAQQLSFDELVRVLPPGKSHITKSSPGQRVEEFKEQSGIFD